MAVAVVNLFVWQMKEKGSRRSECQGQSKRQKGTREGEREWEREEEGSLGQCQ